eukprot:TRINITY_DN396_c0_g1_i2.p1 TRINITY_DN396_c0_g1~~TRINITY_DN396_c0_g1_i2.p1  ORF type:complete len:357 (-),score=135.83 TRINITY_DN396_c0_g1_i2:195-1265(-)
MAFEDPLGGAKATAKRVTEPTKIAVAVVSYENPLAKSNPLANESVKVVVQDRVEREVVEAKKDVKKENLFKIDKAKASALFGDFEDDDQDIVPFAPTKKTPAPSQPQTSAPVVEEKKKKPSIFDDEDDSILGNPALSVAKKSEAPIEQPQLQQQHNEQEQVSAEAKVEPVKHAVVEKKKKSSLLFDDDDSDEDSIEKQLSKPSAGQGRRKANDLFSNDDEDEIQRENMKFDGVFIPSGAIDAQVAALQIESTEDDSLAEIEAPEKSGLALEEMEILAKLEQEKEEAEKKKKEQKVVIQSSQAAPSSASAAIVDDDDLFSMLTPSSKSGSATAGLDSFNFSAYIQQNSQVSSNSLFD